MDGRAFIGTRGETSNDEVRRDAQEIYDRLIRSSKVSGFEGDALRRSWDGLRHRWYTHVSHLVRKFSVSKYSPEQPRAPAGSAAGGQWVSGGGEGGDAQAPAEARAPAATPVRACHRSRTASGQDVYACASPDLEEHKPK